MYASMNAVEYIRTRIFKLKQGPFAVVAGVSQPTISRWEAADCKGSEPSRDEMDNIRKEAIKRGLEWNDSWFFQTFPDEPESAEQESAA